MCLGMTVGSEMIKLREKRIFYLNDKPAPFTAKCDFHCLITMLLTPLQTTLLNSITGASTPKLFP
jgi:hypothetical protein